MENILELLDKAESSMHAVESATEGLPKAQRRIARMKSLRVRLHKNKQAVLEMLLQIAGTLGMESAQEARFRTSGLDVFIRVGTTVTTLRLERLPKRFYPSKELTPFELVRHNDRLYYEVCGELVTAIRRHFDEFHSGVKSVADVIEEVREAMQAIPTEQDLVRAKRLFHRIRSMMPAAAK